MSQEIAVEARDLVKSENSQKIINGIDFKIAKGESYGFLVAKRTGKSLLVRLLSGCTPLTEGGLFIKGLNVEEHHRHIKTFIGVVSNQFVLDEDFSVFDNLNIHGQLHGMSRKKIYQRSKMLLRELRLESHSSAPISRLNKFQKKMLELARALLPEPEIIFLDEPMKYLSTPEKKIFSDNFKKYKGKGSTTVLVTSSTDEIERFCDRVALLSEGKILREGVRQSLTEEVVGREVVEFLCPDAKIDHYLGRLGEGYDYQVFKDKVRVFTKSGQESRVVLQHIASDNLTVRRSHLGDVYVRIVGKEL